MKTGLVHKVPSAIFASGLAIISGLMLVCGFILDTIVKLHRENYELHLIAYERDHEQRIAVTSDPRRTAAGA